MAVALIIMSAPIAVQAKQWSLQDCISYALANNIQLQKTQLTKASAQEDYLQSKSALLPSLSASTNQSVNYTPWVLMESVEKVSAKLPSTRYITMAAIV